MTFFVVASRLNAEGNYVVVQGGFAVAEVGRVVAGDQTWVISVCKGLSFDDPGDSSGKVRAAVDEYASWVTAGFDLTRVTDETVMDDFLKSYAGQEWAAQQARDDWAERQE